MDAKELGKVGEEIACKKLIEKGFTILQRNYRFLKAEVDIVVTKDEKIIFVEVKTRQSSYLSDPALLVPLGKQKQIIRAADEYIKVHYPEKEFRFDIMVVITNSQYTSVEHIEDAFYPMV
jgi:putative endonuclease